MSFTWLVAAALQGIDGIKKYQREKRSGVAAPFHATLDICAANSDAGDIIVRL